MAAKEKKVKVKKAPKAQKPSGLPKGKAPCDVGQALRTEKNKRLNIEKAAAIRAWFKANPSKRGEARRKRRRNMNFTQQ